VTRRFALIGDPVAGSVSPAMHRAAFEATGLDATYDVERLLPAKLPRRLDQLRRTHAGLNVTRPLKEAALPLLDTVAPGAARIGSVNTVAFDPQGRSRGESTDGFGAIAALRRAGALPAERAVVLGTGGAARAVAAALHDDGVSVLVFGRNAEAGRRLAGDLGVRFASGIDDSALLRAALEGGGLLVNATPNGDIVPAGVPLVGLTVFDLVYRPRRTALLSRAAAEGCLVVEGIEMLIEQGARSFEIWTDLAAPVEVMREAAHAALAGEPARGLRP
jgi:shikimate dehydrogenase